MKIKVENLGALKQAEFDLSNFTIICGNNNTGKTYATYALFGFLSYWHETFLQRGSVEIEQSVIDELLVNGFVKIDVNEYIQKNFKKIMERVFVEFTQTLPDVFASPEGRFKSSKFYVEVNENDINTFEKYEYEIHIGGGEVIFIKKNEGDANVNVNLLFTTANKKSIDVEYLLRHFVEKSLVNIIFGDLFPSPFIASAERTGITIFMNEFNINRHRLIEEIGEMGEINLNGKKNKEKNSFFRDIRDIRDMLSKVKKYKDYAKPLKKNTEFTGRLGNVAKDSSFVYKEHPDVISSFSDIIDGEYMVTELNQVYYCPKNKSIRLSMNESSSAVRSLLDVGFYLKHMAKKGDLLMIDEPELNLHPENQRRVARLLARLVNFGIKVFITTHSDYIIKELNTLIMLNGDKPYLKEIAKQEGYCNEELLSPESIKLYIGENATLTSAHIDSDFGIDARSFDTTIDTMNRIQEVIVWGVDKGVGNE